jgi:hypothetical protein
MAIFTRTKPRMHVGEGRLARSVEEGTKKVPSNLFLWAAGGSILMSLWYKIRGREDSSLFIGQWAPTFLVLGIYSKVSRYLRS